MKDSNRFLAGVFISRFGDSFSFLAFTFILIGQGANNLLVSLFMVARYLPSVLIGLWGKGWLDQIPKKKSLMITYFASALLTLFAAFVAEQAGVLLCISLALGVSYGIYVPLQKALVAEIFSLEEIKNVNSRMQLIDVLAKSIGFALAGLSFQTLGSQISFAIDALSFVLIAFLVSSLAIQKHQSLQQTSAELTSLAKESLFSVSLVFALAWVGTGTLFALEASYAKLYLNANEAMIGWLFACATIGALFTPWIIRNLNLKNGRLLLTLVAFIEMVFVVCYAMTTSLITATLSIVAYGMMLTLRHVILATWIHLNIPRQHHASAFGYQQGFANFAMLAGMGLSGPLSDLFGVRQVILVAASLSAIAILGMAVKVDFKFVQTFLVFQWPLRKIQPLTIARAENERVTAKKTPQGPIPNVVERR